MSTQSISKIELEGSRTTGCFLSMVLLSISLLLNSMVSLKQKDLAKDNMSGKILQIHNRGSSQSPSLDVWGLLNEDNSKSRMQRE